MRWSKKGEGGGCMLGGEGGRRGGRGGVCVCWGVRENGGVRRGGGHPVEKCGTRSKVLKGYRYTQGSDQSRMTRKVGVGAYQRRGKLGCRYYYGEET